MIELLTAKDFRKALCDLIKIKANLPYDVFFNHVNDSGESYVWINVQPQKRSWDTAYFQRIINVDISVVLVPDKFTEVKHEELMDISDELDKAIMPCLQIRDRFINVQEFNSHIFDDILHYEFVLDFTDCIPSDEYEGLSYELMKNLEADLNRGTAQRVFVKEAEESDLPDPSDVIRNLFTFEGDD